jgi:hypothetical protein
MSTPVRPLIDELLDWIDREIIRAESGERRGETEPPPAEEPGASEPRERLRVPSSIPA